MGSNKLVFSPSVRFLLRVSKRYNFDSTEGHSTPSRPTPGVSAPCTPSLAVHGRCCHPRVLPQVRPCRSSARAELWRNSSCSERSSCSRGNGRANVQGRVSLRRAKLRTKIISFRLP